MITGTYIVFEGIVGTGKSTQSKMLLAHLQKRFPDREIVLTREPGGSEIAEVIRNVVQATPFTEKMDPLCEAYLYASARAQSLRAVVKPVLERGGIVIADRSIFSSISYQGFGQELGFDTIWRVNEAAVTNILPDIVVYLQLDAATSLARTFDAAGDKFEKFPPDFFARCADGYTFLSHHEHFKKIWHTIDARGSREEVFTRILDVVKTFPIPSNKNA